MAVRENDLCRRWHGFDMKIVVLSASLERDVLRLRGCLLNRAQEILEHGFVGDVRFCKIVLVVVGTEVGMTDRAADLLHLFY